MLKSVLSRALRFGCLFSLCMMCGDITKPLKCFSHLSSHCLEAWKILEVTHNLKTKPSQSEVIILSFLMQNVSYFKKIQGGFTILDEISVYA